MAKRSKKKATSGGIAGNMAGETQKLGWLGGEWMWGLVLFLAVIVAYLPVWRAGYVWDDDFMVTANSCVVGPYGLKEIWTTKAADVCPLTTTTFWFEYKLWGPAPLPYHLVNVLLHGLGAVVLWRVLRQMQAPGAWFGAALWALHPVMAESVAWITEMKNTESCLFYLLAILFFVKGLQAADLEKRKVWDGNYAPALLFSVLAMASKSSTVVLPVVLCLCTWWVDRRWNWHRLAKVVPIFLMAVLATGVSIWTQNLELASAHDSQWARSWPERVAAAGDAVWFYLGKLVWPHPLIAVYPRWQIDAEAWVSYLPLLAVVVVLAVFWANRESWARAPFFVFAYFVVALLPVLGLFDNIIFQFSLVFDHFQYLASMGPLALAGAGLARLSGWAIPSRRWLERVLGSVLLLILGALTWQRASVYESQKTLWTDTVAQNSTCWVGDSNLGVALADMGQIDEAIALYKKALELNPNYAAAHGNLGNSLVKKGQVDAAIAEYNKAIELYPRFPQAHLNLGTALFKRGQVDEARAQFEDAVEINPDDAGAHDMLGVALGEQGHLEAAIGEFQEALRLKPAAADTQHNLEKAQAMLRENAGRK